MVFWNLIDTENKYQNGKKNNTNNNEHITMFQSVRFFIKSFLKLPNYREITH